MQKLKISELKLADVVCLFEGEYGTATVKQIKDGKVIFLRPYVITQDFSYTGGVISSLGYEECAYYISIDKYKEFLVYSRKDLK
jgi:hypothetical protein